MSVRIRLRRMGAKKRPFYRIVVADSRQARDGRFIDQVGHYDPTTEPPTMKVDEEKAKMWLGRGAQPSDVVKSLLRKAGVIESVQPTQAPVEEPAPKKRTKKAAEPEKPAAPVEVQPEAEAEKPAPKKRTKKAAEPEVQPEAQAEESAPAEEQS